MRYNYEERKKEESIALKTSQNEGTEEEIEISYVIKRFSKIINKCRISQRKLPPAEQLLQIIFCHKNTKPGHLRRDCPSQKQETHYTKPHNNDLVPENAQIKAHDNHMVRKAFDV